MAKGRKKIPSKVVELMGGTDKTHKPPREDEPQPEEKTPPCPDVLDEIARNEWDRVVPLLMSIRLLAEIDMVTVAGYCDAYSRWYQSTGKVHEAGMVYQKPDKSPALNPYLRVARDAFDQMMKNACLLGMSPSSRAGLKVSKPKAKSKAEEFRNKLKGKG